MKRLRTAAAVVALGCVGPVVADAPANPVEVGTVHWRRDLDEALAEAGRTGKPVFAFFQEVPGCSGCRRFGSRVMTHPPIVEAVENEFVPVLIYNNRGGRDREILERYGEPAWNYQVVRFLDGEGRDLIPRRDRIWERDALAMRMIRALEAAGRPVPRYLEVTAYEEDAGALATAAFAQACFWSGEAALGRVPGVITTEAGWIEGREVTRVRYRPDLVSLERLVERAIAAGVADRVYLPRDDRKARVDLEIAVGVLDGSYRKAGDADQKRQIRDSPLARLDLSPMQRTKVNAFVVVGKEQALAWLTPSQATELQHAAADRR